jgi:hypothetical protein
MHSGKQTWAMFAGFVFATASYACVESNSDQFGGTITNRCAYPVNVSYCFGDCDNTPRGNNAPLAPGFSRKLSPTPNIRFRISYCRAPAFPDGQGGCVSK